MRVSFQPTSLNSVIWHAFAMCINLVSGKLKAKWLAAIRGSMKKDLKKNPSHGNKELLTMHSDTFAGEDFKVCFSDWQLARTHLAQMERWPFSPLQAIISFEWMLKHALMACKSISDSGSTARTNKKKTFSICFQNTVLGKKFHNLLQISHCMLFSVIDGRSC